MNRFRLPLLLTALLAGLSAAAVAQAAPVTVGPSLSGSFTKVPVELTGTVYNATLGAGDLASSPVSGVILHWRVLDGTGPLVLRVLRPEGDGYRAVGSSAPIAPLGSGVETFPTDLPIRSGDLIGINLSLGETLGLAINPLSSFGFIEPAPGEGELSSPQAVAPGGEVGFNAEVQPAPSISAITPSSGPITGATVTIAGTDFEGTRAVSFGSAPATSFTVNSESQITAVSPSATAAGSVPISVTTAAGTATSTQQFTYVQPAPVPVCTVPKLQGKKLKAAKKKIRAAGCKVGKVGRKKGVTAKSGKVVHQSPKAGRILGAGSQVKVKLG